MSENVDFLDVSWAKSKRFLGKFDVQNLGLLNHNLKFELVYLWFFC